MIYKIEFKSKALKFIESQEKKQRLRIYKAISQLPNGDVKKLAGTTNDYRLRIRRL